MGDESIVYEAREGVAVITLNRPEVLNSVNAAMLDALHEALHRAEAEGQRCVLLTGAGRGFCAGQDLAAIQGDYAKGGPDFVALLREHFHPVVRGIRNVNLPVVAAVNGAAAGAGMSLALACDVRLAADNARFATAFTKIGLIPDAGMAYTLPRLVGAGRASWLLMKADPIDAQTALGIGMVDMVIPAAEFRDRAFTFAKEMAAGPTRAFVLTRQLLALGMSHDLDHVLDIEADLQAQAGATEDHRGAVEAFLRKQPPAFSGR